MNKLDTTIAGGMNLFLEDIAWTQDTLREAINNLFADFAIGTDANFIVSGAVSTITPSTNCIITAGWAYINGLIVKIDGQTVADAGGDSYYIRVVQTLDGAGVRLAKNTGASINPYMKYRGVLYAGTGLATDLNVVYLLPVDRIADKILQKISAVDIGFKLAALYIPKEVGNDSGATTLETGLAQVSTGARLQYGKDAFGAVRIFGSVKNTSGGAIGGSKKLFTLPTAFRPGYYMQFPAIYSAGLDGAIAVTVYANGDVEVYSASWANNQYMNINVIFPNMAIYT